MRSSREHYYQHERLIHELDTKDIVTILNRSVWESPNQSITSAETNNDSDENPNPIKIKNGENTCGVDAFADLIFDAHVKRVLDVGGGKFESCREFMKKQNINLLVWDPFNRSLEHNLHIQVSVAESKVDAATSMSVLNVIPEPEARLAHINILKESLVMDGVAFFKIWPGESTLKATYTPTVNSYGHPGYQANAYPDRFLREVQLVFGAVNTEIHKVIPNLIVARKMYDSPTSEDEVSIIKEMSKSDSWHASRNQYSPQLFNNKTEMPPTSGVRNTGILPIF